MARRTQVRPVSEEGVADRDRQESSKKNVSGKSLSGWKSPPRDFQPRTDVRIVWGIETKASERSERSDIIKSTSEASGNLLNITGILTLGWSCICRL
jgi:hypothetical protein